MSQQINLYDPRLRKQRDLLSFGLVAGATAAVVVALAGSYGFASWQRKGLEQQHLELDRQVKSLQQETVALGKALSERKGDPAVALELESTTAGLARRDSALKALGQAENSESVAAYMRAFARQSMEGLWLTGFSISRGEFEIRGRMLEPSLLPVYIRRLNGEPAFRGRQFAALDINSSSELDKLKAMAGATTASPSGRTGSMPAGKFAEFALRNAGTPSATLKEPGK